MVAAADTREAYDRLAPAYDTLTADYCYERWLDALERLAQGHGLRGRRLLDVACGTGKSFAPMLARGYRVVGCDISEAMLARAAERAPHVPLFSADMRSLDRLGEFDLVTCLDDALNYLLEREDLERALSAIRRNLAPDGIAVWDLNTLAMYRTSFAGDRLMERDGLFLAWRGETSAELAAGGPATVTVELFSPAPDGLWQRASSVHRQRHWPREAVRAAAVRAGLRILAVHGQHPGAVIDAVLDESVHTKAVYLACRDDRRRAGGEAMPIGNI
jgi:SAM-dependent methyltransferase